MLTVTVIFILKNNNNRKTRVHAVFSVNIKCREPNANFCHLEIGDALLTINAVDEQYKKGGKYHTHAHAARGSAEEKTTYNNIIYNINIAVDTDSVVPYTGNCYYCSLFFTRSSSARDLFSISLNACYYYY